MLPRPSLGHTRSTRRRRATRSRDEGADEVTVIGVNRTVTRAADRFVCMFARLRLASLASTPTVTEALPGDLAGVEGEDAVVSALATHHPSARIFREIRVPRLDGCRGDGKEREKDGASAWSKGRYELDVVLASRSCLIVVEVKNWSGAIGPAEDDGVRTGGGRGDWIQTRRDGSTLRHPDPVGLLERKAASLEAWLAAAPRGLRLPAGYVRTKLMLVNGRNLAVDPRLTALTSVYHHDAVDDACRADLSWTSALLAWVTGDMLTRETARAVHAALESAPTWDVLHLEGGATLRGDFRGFEGPGAGVASLSRLVHRRSVERVVVSHTRSYVLGALGAVVAGRTPAVTCVAWKRRGWREASRENDSPRGDAVGGAAHLGRDEDGEDGVVHGDGAGAAGVVVRAVGGSLGSAVKGMGSAARGLVRLAVGSDRPSVLGKVDGVALNARMVFQQAGSRAAHSHALNDIVSLDLSPPP